jgi:hypothetical protein
MHRKSKAHQETHSSWAQGAYKSFPEASNTGIHIDWAQLAGLFPGPTALTLSPFSKMTAATQWDSQ